MPAWTLFPSQAKKKHTSVRHSEDNNSHLTTSDSVVPPITNVSTLSSVEDIVRSVSEVNAAANVSTTTPHTSITTSTANASFSPTDESHLSKLIVKKCFCCGTKLQVPEKLPYFKCAICETFHDVNVVQPQINSSPLTIEAIEGVIDKIRMEQESNTDGITNTATTPVNTTVNDSFVELDNLLIACFSSVDSINESFSLHQKRLSYSKPNISFTKVEMFFTLIMNCPGYERPVKTILTCQLNLLKRLRKNLESPLDNCFLLVILENPIFYIPALFSKASSANNHSNSILQAPKPPQTGPPDPLTKIRTLAVEVLERTVGIIAYSRKSCRHYLLNWLSRYPLIRFQSKVDLFNAYIAHRLLKQYRSMHISRARMNSVPKDQPISNSSTHRRSYSTSSASGAPSTSSTSGIDTSSSTSYLPSRSKKKRSSITSQIKTELYNNDWKISAFVRVLSIFFDANTVSTHKIAISNFYNTMVDYVDVTNDFDEWQKTKPSSIVGNNSNVTNTNAVITTAIHISSGDTTIPELKFTVPGKPSFSFCQYPFLLSMGSKTEILEHDARRQMELKAQEAFFGSLTSKIPESPFLHIRVHRNSILPDSFEAIDKNEDNLKKGLKVEFIDEPGIDAGGLKKEWFLLLFKELFDPSNAFFIEDDESRFCWFDVSSDHSLKYYKLTGVAIGLALYNSTILDVNFPLVLFKKLLGSHCTLGDFTTLYPSYGSNLKKLLDYEADDLEEVFSLDFCIYSKDPDNPTKVKEISLIPNGRNILVNKSNRQDYVKRVIAYYLDTSVKRQFEAFKQGFYKVAGGNALSLFRPEEIELLIRGSLEPIDVDALRSVTRYQHWGPKGYDAEQDIVIKWFWRFFKNLDPENQRKLLIFVTGSDRIPATGISNMPFRISKIGDDCERFPISHTCFNQLCLYKYSTREKLVGKIMTAINESQGFGIK